MTPVHWRLSNNVCGRRLNPHPLSDRGPLQQRLAFHLTKGQAMPRGCYSRLRSQEERSNVRPDARPPPLLQRKVSRSFVARFVAQITQTTNTPEGQFAKIGRARKKMFFYRDVGHLVSQSDSQQSNKKAVIQSPNNQAMSVNMT